MTEETRKDQTTPAEADPETFVHPHDPYPRMIIVCMAIFVVLLMIIFGVIAADFALRQDNSVRPAPTFDTAPAAETAPEE